MKNISMVLVLLCSAIVSCGKSSGTKDSEAAGESYFVFKKDASGVLSAPEVEFKNPTTGKKVLFVGMMHIGATHYYQEVAKRVDAWVQSEPTSVVMLKEFFTCETEVYDIDETSPSQVSANELRDGSLDFNPDVFLNYNDAQIQPLVSAFRMQKKACVLDVDNLNKRPQYLVDRNAKWCGKAHDNQSACQWSDLQFNSAPNLSIRNGDLALDSYAAGMQFSGASAYKGLNVSDRNLLRSLYRPFNYMVLDYRNWHLMQKTLATLNSEVDRVVLPWGAMHIFGLKKLLLEAGFQQVAVRDIPMLTPEDVRKWKDLEKSYNDSHSVSSRYGF